MSIHYTTLYHADNLTILKSLPKNSIDLIYADPPFCSQRTYYTNEGEVAFCDIWTLTEETEDAIRNGSIALRTQGADDDFIQFWETWIPALRYTNTPLLAYVVYMTLRLYEMQRVLKDTGSIYWHCDSITSHYSKLCMDGIFGHDNFVNEIVWCYHTGGGTKKQWAKKHDILLMYAKNKNIKYFKTIKEKSYITGTFGFKKTKELIQQDENGKYFTWVNGRDYWNIDSIGRSSKERVGYPTQKPLTLLQRIIQASCPESGIVLDPFCGCGTTLVAAEQLQRKWIGIESSEVAIATIAQRLTEPYQLKKDRIE